MSRTIRTFTAFTVTAAVFTSISGSAAAAPPSPSWTAPMAAPGAIAIGPTQHPVAISCAGGNAAEDSPVLQSFDPQGDPDWTVHVSDVGGVADCNSTMVDGEGNSYSTDSTTSTGGIVVVKRASAGDVVWISDPLAGFVASGTGVIGANGAVYFPVYNGTVMRVFGVDRASGESVSTPLDTSWVTQLGAYDAGIIVIDTAQVSYYDYDANLIARVSLVANGSRNVAYASIGAAGAVYVALGDGCLRGNEGHFWIERATPTGVSWIYPVEQAMDCSFSGGIAATPAGGAVFQQMAVEPETRMYGFSVDRVGHLNWVQPLATRPDSPTYASTPPRVDEHGTVALPVLGYGPCEGAPSIYCAATTVSFLDSETGDPVLDPLVIGSPADPSDAFTGRDLALAPDRVYMSGALGAGGDYRAELNAFNAPGIGADYRVVLQAAVENVTPQPPSNGCAPEGAHARSDVYLAAPRRTGTSADIALFAAAGGLPLRAIHDLSWACLAGRVVDPQQVLEARPAVPMLLQAIRDGVGQYFSFKQIARQPTLQFDAATLDAVARIEVDTCMGLPLGVVGKGAKALKFAAEWLDSVKVTKTLTPVLRGVSKLVDRAADLVSKAGRVARSAAKAVLAALKKLLRAIPDKRARILAGAAVGALNEFAVQGAPWAKSLLANTGEYAAGAALSKVRTPLARLFSDELLCLPIWTPTIRRNLREPDLPGRITMPAPQALLWSVAPASGG